MFACASPSPASSRILQFMALTSFLVMTATTVAAASTIPFVTAALLDRDPDPLCGLSRPNVFIFGVYTTVIDLQHDAPILR